jgi:type IV fimbrial biogenesis protein FimT
MGKFNIKTVLKTQSHKSRKQGFTIIEMMMVIALVAILTVWVSPSLTVFFNKNKLTSEVNLLNSQLQLAKSTAASQFMYVVFCPSQNRKTCSGNWQDNMITFIDKNHNDEVDETDEIFSTYQASPPVQIQANRTRITFSPINIAGTTAATITLCINNLKKALVISNVGRIRLETNTDKIECD